MERKKGGRERGREAEREGGCGERKTVNYVYKYIMHIQCM